LKIIFFEDMARDPRYDIISPLCQAGKIASFNDIFKYIPKTVVAHDLGKKVSRFNVLINKVEKFTLEELAMIGHFCGLEESIIFKLAEKEYFIQKGPLRVSKIR